MLFIVHCIDKPGHEPVRMANRAAHIAYLETLGEQLVAGGPTQTDDGEHMTGSLLILDLPDRAAVDRFCANDPYARAGLFERVEICRWKRVFPKT